VINIFVDTYVENNNIGDNTNIINYIAVLSKNYDNDVFAQQSQDLRFICCTDHGIFWRK